MPEMVEEYASRPERPCLGCGKRDKSYRDQVSLPDGNVAYYHADCHVLVANCDVCRKVLEAVGTDHTPQGLKDEALVSALIDHLNQDESARGEIFTTEEAVPQPKPAGAQ